MKEERRLLGWAIFIIVLAFLATATVILMEKYEKKQTPIEKIQEVSDGAVDQVKNIIEDINEAL
jgi:uncharacterized membrane protein